MITFIYQSISALGLSFALSLWSASGWTADNYIVDATFHAQVDETHPDRAQLGDYPIIDRWNIHRELSPDEIDVKVRVHIDTDTVLQVDVVPIVGLTRWAETEGITDLARMRASSAELPVYLTRVEPASGGQDHIVISGIPIRQLIEYYSARHLWPHTLIFRLGLAPVKGEIDVQNNVSRLELALDPPD